jgi:hypothetical protein
MREAVLPEAVWERRECVSTELEDSLVLVELETLGYHALNTTAAEVWEILAEPRSADEIVGQLCGRYDVAPERCRESVERLIGQLAGRNLITNRAGAAEEHEKS